MAVAQREEKQALCEVLVADASRKASIAVGAVVMQNAGIVAAATYSAGRAAPVAVQTTIRAETAGKTRAAGRAAVGTGRSGVGDGAPGGGDNGVGRKGRQGRTLHVDWN